MKNLIPSADLAVKIGNMFLKARHPEKYELQQPLVLEDKGESWGLKGSCDPQVNDIGVGAWVIEFQKSDVEILWYVQEMNRPDISSSIISSKGPSDGSTLMTEKQRNDNGLMMLDWLGGAMVRLPEIASKLACLVMTGNEGFDPANSPKLTDMQTDWLVEGVGWTLKINKRSAQVLVQ